MAAKWTQYSGKWNIQTQGQAVGAVTWPGISFSTLYAWGRNHLGQLGDGTTVDKSSPVQVGALTTWLNAATGYAFTTATKTDGTLWAWGMNTQGQLGLGDATPRSSPVQVGALTTWDKPVGGAYNTLATKTDGTLWSWGHNVYGQLGHGNTTTLSSPVQVGALTTWITPQKMSQSVGSSYVTTKS